MHERNSSAGAFTRFTVVTIFASMVAGIGGAQAQPAASSPATSATPAVTYLAQGWSAADRDTFYTTSQGSHLIPYAWFKALRRMDSEDLFMGDQLVRYGYLRSDNAKSELPIGFVVEASSGQLGMTCAACHTAQLEFRKDDKLHVLRLDGAPAHSDFQQFLLDLKAATRETLDKPERFDPFAKAVLGAGQTTAKTAQLRKDFGAWVKQFGEFMDASLPAAPWGPGRLDAFGMIFNRVAARDLGIASNFKVADAPVSYPFLWNASRQDHTQWNGGVPNGLFIQALTRNTGEVYGVFADFRPKIKIPAIGPVSTKIAFKDNSADFAGLQTLEEKIAALKPPPWPRELFGLDTDLAKKGEALFATRCAECHAERPSGELIGAWDTPVRAVGTDPKMADNAARMSDPGIYTGALLPPPAIGRKFTNPAKTSEILATSVIGSLLDEAFEPPIPPPGKLEKSGVWRAVRQDLARLLPDEKLEDLLDPKRELLGEVRARLRARLNNMFTKPAKADSGAAYESRVLQGIWATAPYLHNGSVPNLWELLKPPKDRVASFKVGSRHFDPKNVGYVTEESPFRNGTFETDPNNKNGNGNGGHVYGTDLSDDDRWALVEYLKTL